MGDDSFLHAANKSAKEVPQITSRKEDAGIEEIQVWFSNKDNDSNELSIRLD